jgi:3-oxoadipate enol-lactonase
MGSWLFVTVYCRAPSPDEYPRLTQLTRIGSSPSLAVEWAGKGPLVVCLHGIGGNRRAWSAQIPALACDFTVAAWDARGYLDSDDYNGPLVFSDFAADLERVLDAFSAQCAHIIGQSMGGRIALNFYERCPGRVASLVLVDTSAGSPVQASPDRIEDFLRTRREPLLAGRTPADLAPELARSLVGPHCDPVVLQLAIELLSQLRTESYLKTLETVTRFNAFPRFEEVTVPALVVVGEHDRIATPEYAAEMAHRLPQASLHLLRDAGHLSNMEQPQKFNALVLDFLRPIAARATTPCAPDRAA